MRVRVRLYARFRELAGREEIELDDIRTLSELRQALSKALRVEPSEIYFIVNGSLQAGDLELTDGALVVAFPRVSGGLTPSPPTLKRT